MNKLIFHVDDLKCKSDLVAVLLKVLGEHHEGIQAPPHGLQGPSWNPASKFSLKSHTPWDPHVFAHTVPFAWVYLSITFLSSSL